jgi:FkbM family methyltransferase
MDQSDTSSSRRKRPLWRRFRHWYLNNLSWPVPVWRIKRAVPVTLGQFTFRLAVVSETCSWANVVKRNRWEAEAIAYLRDNLRSGDRFVDIGAWIGPYTLLASRLVESSGVVYSFEPDHIARGALERNIINNSADNVRVVPWAVTEQSGSVNLVNAALGDSTSQTIVGGNGPEVASISLDEFCQTERFIPSVIKIDVEGGETEVVAGGRSSLQQARAILLEFHEAEIMELGGDPRLFWNQLFDLGKRVVLLTPSDGLPVGMELSPQYMLPGNTHVLIH